MTAVLTLEGSLRLTDLSDATPPWISALGTGDLCLDLTAVTSTDAAGLQALVAAAHEATARGRRFSARVARDGAVLAMAERLGLAADLACLVPGDAAQQEE